MDTTTATAKRTPSAADMLVLETLMLKARELKESPKLHERMHADNIARFLGTHFDISFEQVFGKSLF